MAGVESGGVETQNEVEEHDDWEYAGLEAIDQACLNLYPDQPNPRLTSAVIKYWFGGPDPLDYVRFYSNPGDPESGTPAHWHYVTFGFSDLHGDGRVHKYSGADQPSGFGFELTMRLKKEEGEEMPPSWPSGLLSSLSKYVFQTGNVLHTGDHVPWHRPLDESEDSIIQHLLVTQDPQLKTITTPYGFLEFRQIVGVTEDEMSAAQKWKGTGVINLMAKTKEIGPYLITDMQRKQSIFEADPALMALVNEGIYQDGSNLGHVTAMCKWLDINASYKCSDNSDNLLPDDVNEEPACLDGVHIYLDLEAAVLLPMVVKARLQKGKFFVFHNAENYSIHLIPSNNLEAEGDIFVNGTEPIKALDTYLQIYCDNDLQEKMLHEFECLSDPNIDSRPFPLEFHFSNPTILITVSPRGQLVGLENLPSS